MEIRHDKSYLQNNDSELKKHNLESEVIGKICFNGNNEIIHSIVEYLENNYKMYQYKKDNGVNYNEEELFFWTNQSEKMRYFDVTIKGTTLERHNEIVEEIINYIECDYSNEELDIRLQYSLRRDWNNINEYISNNKLLNNLNLTQEIYTLCNVSGSKMTKENKEKLSQFNDEYFNNLLNKKIKCELLAETVFCGKVQKETKGTIKKVGNHFGLFKPRATKTYYHVNLGNVRELQLI